MQVNYTTYDMRREYDIVNPRKHADILVLAPEVDPSTHSDPSGHPFRYARVLGIYHTKFVHARTAARGVGTQEVDFLWVRWYARDTTSKSGFASHRLHPLHLMSTDDPLACSFLNPDDVVRGIHLIPGFAHGYRPVEDGKIEGSALLRKTWNRYYVNW